MKSKEVTKNRLARFVRAVIMPNRMGQLFVPRVNQVVTIQMLVWLPPTIIDAKLVHPMCPPAKKVLPFVADVLLDGPIHPMQQFRVRNVPRVRKVCNVGLFWNVCNAVQESIKRNGVNLFGKCKKEYFFTPKKILFSQTNFPFITHTQPPLPPRIFSNTKRIVFVQHLSPWYIYCCSKPRHGMPFL